MPDPTGWMPVEPGKVVHIPATEWGYPDIREDDMWPQAVINHVMQGYRRTMDDWARSPQPEGKSVQFGINRAGEIAQYVSIWNPSYHAGDVNRPDGWGAVMLGRYGPNPNKWSIGVEWEGFSIPAVYNGVRADDYLYDAAHPWPDAMVQAAIKIHQFVFHSTQQLVDATDKQDRILTHSQTNGATRAQDPGDYWIATVKPRITAAVLQALLQLPATPAPPVPVPVTLLSEIATVLSRHGVNPAHVV